MTVGLLWALAGPGIVTYTLLRAGGGHRTVSVPLAAALAPAMGMGLATCIYFAGLVATGSHAWAVRLDAVFWLAGLLAVGIGVRARGPTPRRSRRPHVRLSPVAWMCALGFATVTVVAVVSFWWHWQAFPYGEWDAWAIWNLRARAIWRGAPDWTDILNAGVAWSHPDYPLLVPIATVRLWAYAGVESTLAPAFVALLFFASTMALVVVSVSQLRGAAIGLLSGTALLAAPAFVGFAACQCADVPLAFYAVAAVSLMAISRTSAEGLTAPAAAGGAAALAAWTKNEGLVVLGVTLALLAAWPGSRSRSQTVRAALAGAVPVAAVIVWFKWSFAPPNYLFAQQSPAMLLARLGDLTRLRFIGDQLWSRLWDWGGGGMSVLAVTAVAVGLIARVDRAGSGRALVAGLFLVGTLGSLALAYVVTPVNVGWQIATSFDRVFVQSWPVVVWAAFQFAGRDAAAHPPF
jgi:hypothetical protein